MEKVYLITGAAGHLGGVLVKKLCESGAAVRALVLPGEKNLPEGVEIFQGDVLDKSSMASFFTNSENKELVVIHSAGIVSIASKYDPRVHNTNVLGTKNIVELCKENKVKKLVYVSSVHAIPELPEGQVISEITDFSPDKVHGYYAKTKAEATAAVLSAKSDLEVCVVHPSGICGPCDNGRGHMTAMVSDYCNGGLTSIIRGGYDFVDVRDVAGGIIAACDKGKNGECYILSNRYFPVREIIYMLHEITGKRNIRTVLPAWFASLTAPAAELYYKLLRKPPLFTSYSLYTLKSNALFSHKKADEELGYRVTDMKQTLADTVAWLVKSKRIRLQKQG